MLKTLAHAVVLFSIENNVFVEKISDCNNETQEKVRSAETQPFFDTIVPELMRLAVVEYLNALHLLVSRAKQEIFDGRWPEPMLILVCGPASPRFGHPAMQYAKPVAFLLLFARKPR